MKMKRPAFHIAIALLFLVATCAFALDTASLVDDPSAKEVLAKKGIRATTAGIVPLPFDLFSKILNRPDLLPAAQKEYARSVAVDGKIKFPIIQTAPGVYYYINHKNQRTDIRKLARKQTGADTLDLILQASGKRFFGKYDAIIHLRFAQADSAGVIYAAQIHAYPHNPAWRFFVRRLGVVERYFNQKTAVIEHIVKTVSVGLSKNFSDASNGPSNPMGISSNAAIYAPQSP